MPRLALALALVASSLSACASRRPASPAPAAAAPESPPQAAAAAPPRPEPSAEPTVRTPADLARDAELGRKAAAVIGAYQNRIAGFAGVLTHDRRSVVFGSNRDGSPQLHLGDVAKRAAEPVALTRGPERVVEATITRDGKWILFTRDRGADENTRIYRIPVRGGEAVELTPEAGVRHSLPVLPLRRPDLMLYTSRTVASPASTVLAQPIAGGPARKVLEDPGPLFLVDAAPDGSRALVLRIRSASELTVFELDVAKGTTRRIHPPEGQKEAVAGAAYAPDGRTIFVATDRGGESSAVLALDATSGKVRATWIPTPATASLDQVLAAPRGGALAVRVNAGNRTELRLLSAATLKETVRPKLPLGSLDVGEFSPDGSSITASLSTPDKPGEPYAVDVKTGAVRILREDARPGASTPADVFLTETPAFDGHPIPIHGYLPRDRGERKLPVIAWFHGGPSASSAIRWSMWAQFFLSQGYAWVEPNIRGSTGFGRAWEMADNREKRGDVLKDMETVNRWIRAQPWASADRIVLFGGSYGGWVVLMGLTRQQPLWKVGVDLVGVADLATLLQSTDQVIRAVFVDEFGDVEKDRALLAEWSPLRDADRIQAPLFVYQGENDPRVRRSESDSIVKAVRRNGRPVEYMIAKDEGHSLDRRENQIEFFARTSRFLEDHLR
jgi:dipeptidyl aminopeptidase/acylaminoacyl peptidase